MSRAGSRDDARAQQLATNLSRVRERIAGACAAAGRDPGEVTLTVVTKFFPSSDVRILADLGVHHVGENRHQEAVEKWEETRDLPLTWHFVGTLQTNKAAAVAAYADVVESVDRRKLVTALSKGAHAHDTTIDVLVQVSLDPPDRRAGSGRGGAPPVDVVPLAELVAAADGLRLGGVMAVAPPDEDPAPAFATLAELAREVRTVEPRATAISAGMSADLEAAIEVGATHVRVGSAVLGERPQIK